MWAEHVGCQQGLPPSFPRFYAALEILVTPCKAAVLDLDYVFTE